MRFYLFLFFGFLNWLFFSYNHCLWNVPVGIRKGQRHIMSRHLSKQGEHFIQKDELESILNGLCLLVGCIVGKIYNICQLTKEDAGKLGVDQKKAKREWEILRNLDSNHYRNSLRAGNYLVGLIDNLVDKTREINPDLPHLRKIGGGSGRFLCGKDLHDYGFLSALDIHVKIYSRNHNNELIWQSENDDRLQVPLYAYSLEGLKYQTQFLNSEKNDKTNFFNRLIDEGEILCEGKFSVNVCNRW